MHRKGFACDSFHRDCLSGRCKRFLSHHHGPLSQFTLYISSEAFVALPFLGGFEGSLSRIVTFRALSLSLECLRKVWEDLPSFSPVFLGFDALQALCIGCIVTFAMFWSFSYFIAYWITSGGGGGVVFGGRFKSWFQITPTE